MATWNYTDDAVHKAYAGELTVSNAPFCLQGWLILVNDRLQHLRTRP